MRIINNYYETIGNIFSELKIGVIFKIPEGENGHYVYIKLEEWTELIDIDSNEEKSYNALNFNTYQHCYINPNEFVYPYHEAELELKPSLTDIEYKF